MKLAHPDLEGQLDFGGENFFEWVIESPTILTKYLQELYAQILGSEGAFVLSDNGEELSLERVAEIIVDPFSLDNNNRKVINKLYAELSDCAIGEEMYLQTQEIMSAIQSYFLTLEEHSAYMLSAQQDIDVVGLFKILDIRLTDDNVDILEALLNHIKISSALMKKRLLIFVNFGGYFDRDSCAEMLKTAVYNEINLLFIENLERDNFTWENRYIIDKDGCEIF